MSIKIGDYYKQKPSYNKLPFQESLRYIVNNVENEKVYFCLVDDPDCNYIYYVCEFENYLIPV